MARSREEARAGRLTPGGWIPLASYLCVLAFAVALLWMVLPESGRRGEGLVREYRPYLVLELPVDSAKAAESTLEEQLDTGEAGPPHSVLIKRQRLQPEEYIRWLKKWSWEGEHLTRRVRGTEYEIYFVPAVSGTTQVPIPVGYEYRLSGSGGDGFIITTWKKKGPGPLERLLAS